MAVTHQLQALRSAGQVTLTVDPADRRSWFVALTDAGRAELDRLTTIGMDRFALFVADWDAQEVRTLTRLLGKFEALQGRGRPPRTTITETRQRPQRQPYRPPARSSQSPEQDGETAVATLLSTEGLAYREREAFWRQAMSETFVPLTVGEVEADHFGGPSGPTGSVG